MTKQMTTIKMSDSEALEYLDFIQDEIRVKYPGLILIIEVRIPYAPYSLILKDRWVKSVEIVLHWSHGESLQNRIYHLKNWWENNQDQLKPYLRK